MFAQGISTTVVSATYIGAQGVTHTATPCSVQTSTQINCLSAVGIDVNHKWTVVVAGQSSAQSAVFTSYIAPAVTAVSTSPSLLVTNGGALLTITGTNFGPTASNPVTVTYGSFSASACTVTVANTQITCTSVPGIGTNLRITVATSQQTSVLSPSNVFFSYAAPTVTNVASSPAQLPTLGAQLFTVTGTNFGDGSVMPVVQYGSYTATGCPMTTKYSVLTCYSAPGLGAASLTWVLTIGGQSTTQTTWASTYIAPSISGVTAPTLNTAGGDSLVSE